MHPPAKKKSIFRDPSYQEEFSTPETEKISPTHKLVSKEFDLSWHQLKCNYSNINNLHLIHRIETCETQKNDKKPR